MKQKRIFAVRSITPKTPVQFEEYDNGKGFSHSI